jgi:hypothetical protein
VRTKLARSVPVDYNDCAAVRKAGLSKTPNLELLRHGRAMRALALQTSFAVNLSREGALSTMIDL